jgi:hypothetical protein
VDRETGKITEISPPLSASDNERVNSWDAFKETVYSAADVVTSLPSKVNPKPTTPSNPVDGYSSRQRSKLVISGESPGDRLMKEYQARALDTRGENETPRTAFDELKTSIYNTVDGVANILQPPQLQKATTTPPIQKMTQQSFKTPVKRPTFASSPVIKEALPDLQSKSPGKRWLAELKIRNWEQEQFKKKRNYQREQAAEKFKASAYQFGDNMVDFFGSLVELPNRIKEASQNIQQASTEFVESVEMTVETVKDIPIYVTANVETTVETTKQVMKDVQAISENIKAIPVKVEETYKTTRDTVEETITNVKVLVGVEQKKPAPPKVPPPPPVTAQELALNLAGGFLTVTAKAAWSMTVGMTKVGLSGAKLAYSIMMEQIAQQKERGAGAVTESPQVVDDDVDKSQKAKPLDISKETDTAEKNIVSESKAPTTTVSNEELNIDMDALNQEVMDALELADMAIKMADEGKSDNNGSSNYSELDEALRTAREAAILAINEAAEIERNMKKP